MKKSIAILLTVLMVMGMVGSAGAATIGSLVGEGATIECTVETDIMVRRAGATNYNKTTELTAVKSAGGNFFDFSAVVDLANVKTKFNNTKALMVTKINNAVENSDALDKDALKADYMAALDALKIEGGFDITITYTEGLIMPEMTHDMLVADEELFAWDVPVDNGTGTITLRVNVAENVTVAMAAADLFGNNLVMTCEGIEVEELGEYTITGAFSGATNIVEGEETLSNATYVAVQDSSDADGALSAIVKVRESTGSSTSSKEERPTTTTPPATEDKETATTTVSGSTATVTKVNTDKIAEGSDVAIDTTATGKKVTTVKVSAPVVEDIAEKKAGLDIALDGAKVELEAEALAEAAKDAKVTDKLEVSVKADGDKIDVTLAIGSKDVASKAKITVDYKVAEGKVANTLEVVDAEGNAIPATYDEETGKLTIEAGDGEYKVVTASIENVIILTIGEAEAMVYGEEKTNDVAPKITKDRTMLPIRFVAENLGADVAWDAETRIVTITDGETTIKITIDSDVALVNGEEVKLDSEAHIENDRTYIPVRFVAESLKAKVFWNEKTQNVTIVK